MLSRPGQREQVSQLSCSCFQVSKNERQVMKPLYDRYRLVKQILSRASTIPIIVSTPRAVVDFLAILLGHSLAFSRNNSLS